MDEGLFLGIGNKANQNREGVYYKNPIEGKVACQNQRSPKKIQLSKLTEYVLGVSLDSILKGLIRHQTGLITETLKPSDSSVTCLACGKPSDHTLTVILQPPK